MYRFLIAALALQCVMATAAMAQTRQAPEPKRNFEVRQLVKSASVYNMAFMRVYGQASPPIGYVQFCQRLPEECAGGSRDESRHELTPTRLLELDRINRLINREIAPATDLELYGVEEYWTYPDARKKGDCEDYVLLKRRLLLEQGWPAAALLITVVRDERRDGHAILTVRTAQGDFVLDNKSDEIKPWHRSGYDFVMRQSYLNPRVWMSLEQNQPASQVAVSAPRTRQ
jgi:predicted transglutaminase-like cysteine proteinase